MLILVGAAANVGFCIRTMPGKSWRCQWTNILLQSRIEVAGSFMDEGDPDFAILGDREAAAWCKPNP